jgi:hypothetical protein
LCTFNSPSIGDIALFIGGIIAPYLYDQRGFLSFCSYNIQHCFICRPSDSTVPTDAGIEPRTVATDALVVRRSNHYRLDLIRKLYYIPGDFEEAHAELIIATLHFLPL